MTTAAATATNIASPRRGGGFFTFIGRFGTVIFLIALIAFFSLTKGESFLQPLNLFNVLRQVSFIGIIAVGMTFVILTAGIDLSVGSIFALGGIVAAGMYKGSANLLEAGAGATSGLGVAGALAVGAGIGLLCGLLQGTLIARLGIPAFIVTLGGMSAFRGLTLQYSNGGPISAFDKPFTDMGKGLLFDSIPYPVLIFLGIALAGWIVLRYTQYGRYIYAVGGNMQAARLSGLPVAAIITSVYVIVGLLSGLAGVVGAARFNSAEAVAGVGYELSVIASVVIGGTSLFGGEGGIFGTVIGTILIGVLSNGLTLLNVQSYTQQIIIGGIIVFAVFFDGVVKRRRR